MTGGGSSCGSAVWLWDVPDGRLRVEVFEALGHADGQQHQRELFLQGQGLDVTTSHRRSQAVWAVLCVPSAALPPAPAGSACSPAASCVSAEPPSWLVQPAAPPSSRQHTRADVLSQTPD